MGVPKKAKPQVVMEIQSPFGGDVEIYERDSDDDPGRRRAGTTTGE